MARNIITS